MASQAQTGALTGGISGAAIGTAILPGIGTFAGFVVGGLLGQILGNEADSDLFAAEEAKRQQDEELDFARETQISGARAQRLALLASGRRFSDSGSPSVKKESGVGPQSQGQATSALASIADQGSNSSGTF